jgi:hypothetical protein
MTMFEVFQGEGNSPQRSERARAKRIAQIGLTLVADNGPALSTYGEAPQAVAQVHDPIEAEAVRLAERFRTEHKRASASCGDHRSEFEVPEWSCQDVFYRTLAILNREGMRLANMRVGRSEGTMSVSFFEERADERSVWDMLPSDCNPPDDQYAGA